jgi:hypothetical protein
MGIDSGRVLYLTRLFCNLSDDPPQNCDTRCCESGVINDFDCFVHETLLLGCKCLHLGYPLVFCYDVIVFAIRMVNGFLLPI